MYLWDIILHSLSATERYFLSIVFWLEALHGRHHCHQLQEQEDSVQQAELVLSWSVVMSGDLLTTQRAFP